MPSPQLDEELLWVQHRQEKEKQREREWGEKEGSWMDLCISGADVAATINVLLIKLKCAFVIAKLLASAKDFKELPQQV